MVVFAQKYLQALFCVLHRCYVFCMETEIAQRSSSDHFIYTKIRVYAQECECMQLAKLWLGPEKAQTGRTRLLIFRWWKEALWDSAYPFGKNACVYVCTIPLSSQLSSYAFLQMWPLKLQWIYLLDFRPFVKDVTFYFRPSFIDSHGNVHSLTRRSKKASLYES